MAGDVRQWWAGHKQRWLPVLLLGLGLFAVNAIARFITKLVAKHDADLQTTIGLYSFIAVGVVVLGVAMWWTVIKPMPRMLADIAVAAVLGCVLSVLVGPYAGGSHPYAEGGLFFWGEIWHYLALAALGTIIAFAVVTATGRDHRSRALALYAQKQRTKPPRVVRR